MKNKHPFYLHLARLGRFCLFAGILLVSTFSCEKNDDLNSGPPPVIKQVRLVDPAKKDSTFTQALPGTLVVIQGENLHATLDVYFNDMEAPFNAVYNTTNNLIVTIPADAPTEATNPKVSNKIRLVTTHGETTFDFVLLAPPPSISGMSNENATGGSKVRVYGSNFYLVQKVVFPGNLDGGSPQAAADGNSIEVTVPANVSTSGPIKVITKYGESTSVFPFGLKAGPRVMSNFDDQNTLEWGCSTSSDDSRFPSNAGQFALLEFKEVGANDAAWWNGGRSINTTKVQWVPSTDLGATLDSYAVKFEVFVKEKWNTGTLLLLKDYNWTYVARYAPWKVGDKVVDFSNDSWQTVTIPLSEFRTKENGIDGSGASASSIQSLVGDGLGSMHFFFVNDGSNAIPTMAIGVDNIRIVKIK